MVGTPVLTLSCAPFKSDAVTGAGIVALSGAALAVHLATPLHHDPAWYLVAGDAFLSGAKLYRDIFVDVCPPLGLFLSLPAVAAARLSGISAVTLYVIFTHIIILLGLLAGWAVMRSGPSWPAALRHGLLAAGALTLNFIIADQFGQREHLMMALIFPYLLLAARRREDGFAPPHRLTVLAGIMGGIGFAIKPHYVLIPLALEIARLTSGAAKCTILRTETLALGGVFFVYGAAVLLWAPDYLWTVMPLALSLYDKGYGHPSWMLLLCLETIALPLAAALYGATRRDQDFPAAATFLLAGGCFFLTYLVQGKGWYYHLYPASSCLIVGCAAMALGGRRGSLRRLGLLALGIATLLSAFDLRRGLYNNGFAAAMAPYVAAHAPAGPIAVFSSHVWAGFPLVNDTGARWSLRFPCLWMVPGLARSPGAFPAEEQYFRDVLIADLEAAPPALVIVDNRREKQHFPGIDFDYLAYLQQDPRFAAFWKHYEPADDSPLPAFPVYRRKD